MSEQNWRKKLKELFVVSEPEPKEIPEPVEPQKEEKPEAPPLELPSGEVLPADINFAEVFTAGGVEPTAQESVTKAAELLKMLPKETPLAIRKQIVEASLRAFGFPSASICEAGRAEIEALDAFLAIGEESTQNVLGDVATKIKQFQDEIERLRGLSDQRRLDFASQKRACTIKKEEILEILCFFDPGQVSPPEPSVVP